MPWQSLRLWKLGAMLKDERLEANALLGGGDEALNVGMSRLGQYTLIRGLYAK